MPRDLTLADGQLGTSAASILAGTGAPPSGRVNVILHNTTAVAQTVLLTFLRDGGSTARRLGRAVLKENESAIARGIVLQAGDTLQGQTTGASAVDYLIVESKESDYSLTVYEADGSPKRSQSVTVETTEKASLSRDGIVLSGLLEEIRDVLLNIP